jgi:hypothetical protein
MFQNSLSSCDRPSSQTRDSFPRHLGTIHQLEGGDRHPVHFTCIYLDVVTSCSKKSRRLSSMVQSLISKESLQHQSQSQTQHY